MFVAVPQFKAAHDHGRSRMFTILFAYILAIETAQALRGGLYATAIYSSPTRNSPFGNWPVIAAGHGPYFRGVGARHDASKADRFKRLDGDLS
jgi:hypothetical protein